MVNDNILTFHSVSKLYFQTFIYRSEARNFQWRWETDPRTGAL